MSRKEELLECIKDLDESHKMVLKNLIDEVVYLEEQMVYLRSLPQIKVNPNNPSMQKLTEASKQYKILSQSYMNAVRILIGELKSKEESESNALLAKLAEFA